MNAGTFELASMGDFDLAIEGGYKFGGSIGFSYVDANASLEDDDPDDRLTFDGINIIVRDVFKLPLSLSWFVGTYDVFASGSEFPVSFGTAEIASAYSGFMYFPTGVQYDGIHQVKGTGLRISSMPVPDKLLLLLYLYQDSWFLDGSAISSLATGPRTCGYSPTSPPSSWKDSLAGRTCPPRLRDGSAPVSCSTLR